MSVNSLKSDLIHSVSTGQKTLRDIIISAHLIAAESTNLGLASTLRERQHPEKIIEEAGDLETVPITRLIKFLESDNLLKAAVGMAVINSVLPIPKGLERGNAFGLIQSESYGKNLGIVGHFHFVDRLQAGTKNCWVFEKEPQGADLDESQMAEFLPQCDVVVITGQALMNGTIDRILDLSRQAYKLLLGPSAPLSPVLFDYGIDAIGSVRIKDNKVVKKYIRQGANFRQLPGVELLVMVK